MKNGRAQRVRRPPCEHGRREDADLGPVVTSLVALNACGGRQYVGGADPWRPSEYTVVWILRGVPLPHPTAYAGHTHYTYMARLSSNVRDRGKCVPVCVLRPPRLPVRITRRKGVPSAQRPPLRNGAPAAAAAPHRTLTRPQFARCSWPDRARSTLRASLQRAPPAATNASRHEDLSRSPRLVCGEASSVAGRRGCTTHRECAQV